MLIDCITETSLISHLSPKVWGNRINHANDQANIKYTIDLEVKQ